MDVNNRMKTIFVVLLALAAIGIFSNIGSFFSMVGKAVIAIAAIYFIYRLVIAKRYGTSIFPKRKDGPTRAQIKKAQRTSSANKQEQKRVFKQNGAKPATKAKSPLKKGAKRRSGPQLTVIEGKGTKPKRKKKA